MPEEKEVIGAILSDSKVISSKVSSLEQAIEGQAMNETTIAKLEFDIVYGIAQSTAAWEGTNGKVSGSVMGHSKQFKTRITEVFKMEAQEKRHDISAITGKAFPKYSDLGKLCHPSCAGLLNEWVPDPDDDKDGTFAQSYHHSTLLTESWTTIWGIVSEEAKVGSKTDTTIRSAKAKELINCFALLQNNGNSSSEVAVKERCDSFINRLYELKYDDLANKLSAKVVKDDGTEVIEAKQLLLNDGNKFRFIANELGYKKTSKKKSTSDDNDDVKVLKTANTQLTGKTANLESELKEVQKQLAEQTIDIPDTDKVENVNEAIDRLEKQHEHLTTQADEIREAIDNLRAKQTKVDHAKQVFLTNPKLLAQMKLAGIALPPGFEGGDNDGSADDTNTDKEDDDKSS